MPYFFYMLELDKASKLRKLLSPHWFLGARSQSHALAVRLGVLLRGQDAVSHTSVPVISLVMRLCASSCEHKRRSGVSRKTVFFWFLFLFGVWDLTKVDGVKNAQPALLTYVC